MNSKLLNSLPHPKVPLLIAPLLALCVAADTSKSAEFQETHDVTFTFGDVTGIGHEAGIGRRDPSDVLKIGDTCYVWYTKIVKGQSALYPSGYNGTVWYATSKDDGRTWTEQGTAIDQGPDGAFDSYSVFTPNVLKFKGRYYLYYTAVADGFKNKGYTKAGKTSLGLCVADKPEGPWEKLDTPIMVPSEDHARFDSYRIDDTCLLVRNDKVWMYYKGRQWGKSPRHTKMGVAIGDTPEGPYERQNDGEPVQNSGHEVQIWQQDGTVYSLVSYHGPLGKTVQKAEDGLNFEPIVKLEGRQPRAPGLCRPELVDPDTKEAVQWGIDHDSARGDIYLQRYTIDMQPKKKDGQALGR